MLPSTERKLKYLKEFQFLSPPSYAGSDNPFEAEEWLRGIKKRMDMVDLPRDLRIVFAAYMLTGEADHWWDFTQRGRDVGSMTWEDFETLFLNKYFPLFIRKEKNREFFLLEQEKESLTVAEFEDRFIQLSRYAPEYMQTESDKVAAFRARLNPSYKSKDVMEKGNTFAEVVREALKEEAIFDHMIDLYRESSSSSGGKMERDNDSAGRSRWAPYNCYKCGQLGHIQRNCPSNWSSSPST